MTDAAVVVPTPIPTVKGWRRLLIRPFVATVRASLHLSPRPMAYLIRRQFARSAALTKAERQSRPALQQVEPRGPAGRLQSRAHLPVTW